MKRWSYKCGAVCIGAVSVFLWCAHIDHRGFAGHTVRWFKGDGLAIQEAQDLAEDLRNVPALADLQPWAVTTIQRFRLGELLTNAATPFSCIAGIHLAASEIPEFIKKHWGSTNDLMYGNLDVSVFEPPDSLQDLVAIHFYSCTVVVGPTTFMMPADKLSGCAKAKPGVYVYTIYR